MGSLKQRMSGASGGESLKKRLGASTEVNTWHRKGKAEGPMKMPALLIVEAELDKGASSIPAGLARRLLREYKRDADGYFSLIDKLERLIKRGR